MLSTTGKGEPSSTGGDQSVEEEVSFSQEGNHILGQSLKEQQVEEEEVVVVEEEAVVVGEDGDNGEDGEDGEGVGEKEKEKEVVFEEDVDTFLRPDWSSTLSESELDMLVYLKHLAVVQTRNAGCETLIEEFDDRKLRLLGSFLTAYLKERMKAIRTENFRPFDGFKLLLSEHERHLRSVACSVDANQPNSTTRKRKRKGKG